jgi:2'-5' RNA ligase
MRLFVAIDVDAATRKAAERLHQELKRERPLAERALRWVDPANLHLTLRFIGERDDVEGFGRALAEPFAPPAVDLTWGVPSWLPPRGRPRVFYVAVDRGVEVLRALADEVTVRLDALGVPPENRPFTAHLTLARVRDDTAPGIVRQLPSLVPSTPFAPGQQVHVDSVVLYQSHLSPRGPRYEARQRTALRTT